MMFWTPLLACSAAIGAPVTTGSLLRESFDLEALTRAASPPYKLVQFSSYDRESRAPYAPGWYANSDGFGGESTPNFLETLQEPGPDGAGRYLMARVDGPGAIVRTWSAAHAGKIRLWLDDAETPLYDGPAEPFLVDTYRILAEKAGLTVTKPDGFQQNQACYLPMPFARSLRIEWIGNPQDIHFYHIEVRCFPEGTEVRTFQPQDLVEFAQERKEASATLGGVPPMIGGFEPKKLAVTVAPGERVEALKLEGSSEIVELELKADAERLTEALRQTILRIHFDGAPQPQVECPVGDFYGAGPGLNPYVSLPFSVNADGRMVCRFPMPFRESAQVLLENLGEQEVRVEGAALVAHREWTDDSFHFHCIWDVDHDLTARGGDQAIDLPILNARGRGSFVGVAVMLLNPCSVPTEGGNWWGEGDEKIWTDDDTFPSLFGTGSEDYFNYAWSRPDHFWYAYCAQPLNTGPGTRGLVANNRWHILDAIPFEHSVDFYIELFSHSGTPGFTYARAAYFYADTSVRDRRMPITPSDVRQGFTLPDGWDPVPAGAARGAIFFQAEDPAVLNPAPNAEVVSGAMWAGRKMVRWVPRDADGSLSFRVQAPEARRYQIVVTAALSPRGGRFSLSVDAGAPMDPKPDLYTPFHELLRNYFLDQVELAEGEHTLTIRPAARDARSGGGEEIGIDFLWLLPR